ncbi:molecular chaperone DnaJ [Methylobacterium sp.]|uniref:molecular chaperone DnaJ n=1 Tax=Methylobacterium sp. TaxID=409 RepID=UPI003B007615
MMDWTDWNADLENDRLEALRPLLEEYAIKARCVLRLVDALLHEGDRHPDVAHKYERLQADYHEAVLRIEALQHQLETARAWISTLQTRIAEAEDIEEREAVYSVVGLTVTVEDVVVVAARRALLAHLHPDRAAEQDKIRMSAQFATASAAFDRIERLRR